MNMLRIAKKVNKCLKEGKQERLKFRKQLLFAQLTLYCKNKTENQEVTEFWLHFDWIFSYIFTVFWLHFGQHFGCTLSKFWLHFGYILVGCWLYFEWILAAFWLHFDCISTDFWLNLKTQKSWSLRSLQNWKYFEDKGQKGLIFAWNVLHLR